MKNRPQRILISVTDKTGIEKFKALSGTREIISTGGTAKALREIGIPCTLIEDVTGFPEMMNGRLKTLHPKIFGGILADQENHEHMAAITREGILPIDIVIVNLYAFEKDPCIEKIDIGGPSLLRAAAKNGSSVIVVVDPNDYDKVISEILYMGVTDPFREVLATKVFEHTYKYDKAIYEWMKAKLDKHEIIFEKSPAPAAH